VALSNAEMISPGATGVAEMNVHPENCSFAGNLKFIFNIIAPFGRVSVHVLEGFILYLYIYIEIITILIYYVEDILESHLVLAGGMLMHFEYRPFCYREICSSQLLAPDEQPLVANCKFICVFGWWFEPCLSSIFGMIKMIKPQFI
jgi:hypothetical protein